MIKHFRVSSRINFTLQNLLSTGNSKRCHLAAKFFPRTLNFLLRGEGRTIAAIAQNLSGSVDLTSNGGYLRGFDVARVLRQIERRPLSEAQKRPASASTPGQSSSLCADTAVFGGSGPSAPRGAYIPARRSSASFRSIFLRAAISLRFRFAEGFS